MADNAQCTSCRKVMLQLRTSGLKCSSCKVHLFKDDDTVEQVADTLYSTVCVGRSVPHSTTTVTGQSGGTVGQSFTAEQMTVNCTQKEEKPQEAAEENINDFKMLIERTERLFGYQTRKSLKQVKDKLKENRLAIITGFPKEGKTTLAANAADWFVGRKRYAGLYYKNASTANGQITLGDNRKSIIVVDNMFTELKESRDILDLITLEESSSMYIIVCQLYDLKRARRDMKTDLLSDKYVVNVSDINASQCTGSELEPLLQYVSGLSSNLIQQTVKQEYFLGLPGICFYYNNRKHFPNDVSFFGYPHSFYRDLIWTICKTDPQKRATFILLLICGGYINIKRVIFDETLSHVMQIIKNYFVVDATLSWDNVKNEIEHLNETFFKESKPQIFTFRYQVMYDACVVAVDRLYPGNLWKECRLRCIHNDDMDDNNNEVIVLTKSNSTVLIEEFLQRLKEKHFSEVLTNDMLRDKDIMAQLYEKMEPHFSSLLHGSDYEHGGNFLFWCLKSENDLILERVMNLKDTLVVRSAITSCIEKQSDDCLHVLMTQWIPEESRDGFLNFKDNNGNTPLMKASMDGSVCIAQVLLEFGADTKATDNHGQNCIHIVSIYDHLELYKFFEINLPETQFLLRDIDGNTSIHLACNRRGNIFTHLLHRLGIEDDGEQINTRSSSPRFDWKGRTYSIDNVVYPLAEFCYGSTTVNDEDNTILNVACFSGYRDVVEILLQLQNVNVNIKGKFGRTPVLNASYEGNFDVLKLLVQKGADPTIKDSLENTILHLACCKDNVKCVEYLVHELGGDIHARNKIGITPLMVAAGFGCRNVFDFLVEQGADISDSDVDNDTVLHRTCFKDNVEFVQYLVHEKKLDIHARDKHGTTPLMYAAQFGCRIVFDFLLEQGADISDRDVDNDTVLHRAGFNDNFEFVQYLVHEKKLDIHARDKHGRTPLMYAAEFGCRNVFDFLMSQNADNSVLDNDKRTVLHRACFNDNVEFVQYLVREKRLDIHARDKHGRTPLMYAAQFGCRNVFDFLMSQNAVISVLDNDKCTVLHRACFKDNVEFVQYLVREKRLDIHARDKHGRTPLMYAAQVGCRKVFDFLMSQNADISVLDNDNGTVLHRACFNDNVEFVQYLVHEKKLDIHVREKHGRIPLMTAAQFGCRNVFDFLMSQNAVISVLDNDKCTVLHRACFKDNVEFVQYLVIEKRLDIHARDKDGRTPLMYAAQFGYRNVFDFIMSQNAVISVLDNDKCTVLHRACFKDNVEFVQYLVIEKRLDIHARDKDGRTPLMYAAQFGYRNVFDFIMSQNAVISVLDNDKCTVLHRACFKDNVEFVQYLVIEKRLDIHARDKDGRTPLMYAAQFGCRNVFDFIMSQNAVISVLDNDKRTVLHRACFNDKVEFVKYLVREKRMDIHVRDKRGRTPLMHAAQFGCRNVFDFLMSQNAVISVLDNDKCTVLHRACFKDNVEFVQYLVIEKRLDIHARDKDGRTSLMYAAEFGCRNVFDFIMSQNADISVLDNDKCTVLHRACFKDNVEFVQYLVIEKRLDIQARDKDGRTPLMYAAQFGYRNVFDFIMSQNAVISVLDNDKCTVLHRACFKDNVEFVQYLVIEKRLDIHTRDKDGRTPLMYAAEFGCRNVFDFLMSQNAVISVLDNDKCTVLHRACCKDNVEFVQYLVIEKRLDIQARDKDGRTPLMYAAQFGYRNVFDFIMSQNAVISVLDNDKCTVLHRACFKDNVEFVQYLVIEKRLDIHTRDKDGRTPLMYAAQFGCRNVFDFLMSQNAVISVLDNDKCTVLHRACLKDNVEFVQYLVIEKRLDIHARDKDGRTPLINTAEFGCRNVFYFLMSQKAVISVLDNDKLTVLHRACLKDNVEFVQYLVIEKRLDIHARDKHGRTPLMYAAQFGCRNVFDFLMSQKANISVLDNDKFTVLHQACLKDNVEFVQYLVREKRLDIHARDKDGRTPLMYAAQFGCRSVFDFLMSQNEAISVLDNDKHTVLHLACLNDNVEFVQYLVIEKRLDIHARDKHGTTPLMYAAQFGCRNVFDFLMSQNAVISVLKNDKCTVLHRACFKDNVEFVQYLVIEKRLDIHARDKEGRTPLMYAAQFGCRSVFDFLMSQNEAISVLDNDKHTVLHLACLNDNVEFVQYLVIEKRLDIHARDKDGRTPLMYAAQFGCRNVFDFLMSQKAVISVLDNDKCTVLHRACFKDNVEFVQYLVIEKRLDIHARDKDGRTPLMYAAQFGYRNVFDFIMSQNAVISVLDNDKCTVLHRACFKDNVEFVQYLVIEKRLDIHARDKDGRTPLMYAAQFGCRNVFDFIMSQNAVISVLDNDKRTVLHRACFNDKVEFVQYLVREKRLDIHARDKDGRTSLMYAAQFGCRNVFEFLISQNAVISVLDNDKRTVLHRACFNDNVEFVQYLVHEKRMDIYVRDKNGRTPLMYAAQFGCRNVLSFLRSLQEERKCQIM